MLVLLSMLRPIFVIELLIDDIYLGIPLNGLFMVSMIYYYSLYIRILLRLFYFARSEKRIPIHIDS